MLAVHKPLSWTSFDVVSRVRALLKRKLKQRLKVGHAGTLDPLADGLLILCTGRFTKRLDEYQAKEKEYTGTFTIGATTPCYDLEKPVDQYHPVDHITDENIYETAKGFLGRTPQVPPQFSAIKVEGQRAYDLARAGEGAILEPRLIEITECEITRIERLPAENEKGATIEVDFRVVCSKGTYIRALARDFGKKLGSGAHLSKLRRTRIGEITLEQALTLEQIKTIIEES